jgi:hypothetical protein
LTFYPIDHVDGVLVILMKKVEKQKFKGIIGILVIDIINVVGLLIFEIFIFLFCCLYSRSGESTL